MQPVHDDQIARFLETHRFQISALLEEAYVEAGGHYAALSPEARRQQATTDSGEYIAALAEGTIDRAAVQAVAHQARGAGVDVRDILRMSNALERHVTAFIAATLPQEPELAQALLRRARNIAASFRTNLATASLDDTLRRFPPT